MNYPLAAALLWLGPLLAFIVFRPWLRRSLKRTVFAAVLCFTPAFAVYGFGGMFELLPLVVAIPSWPAAGGPAWASAMLMAHFVPIGMVGIVVLGLAVRAGIGDRDAPGPPSSHSR